jgi:hypothetical protein
MVSWYEYRDSGRITLIWILGKWVVRIGGDGTV